MRLNKAQKSWRIFLGIMLLVTGIQAQSVPSPAPTQSRAILLQNGIIHVGDGKVIENGSLLFENGKIVQIGTSVNASADVEMIDLAGKHIYPGMIATVSSLGIQEIEAVRATRDNNEVGEINPNVRAIVSYNTDSRITPTVRSNGILLAQVSPDGNLLAGLSSIVQLDAWNWEDAVYELDDALHLNWPSQQIWTESWAAPKEAQQKRISENLKRIEETFDEARRYLLAKEAGKIEKVDQRWEAMLPFLKGEKQIYVYSYLEKDIRAALEFATRRKLKIVLVGAADAWRLTGMLKELQVPVILQKPHSLPRTEDDPVDLPFKTAIILNEAGILTSLSIDNFWNYRNLPFQAGQLVAMGLDKEVALQMITSNTAKILGIDSRTGTLNIGMDANIIVSTGDLLDMRTSNIELAYIQGRKIDLGNKQKDLYKKFGGE